MCKQYNIKVTTFRSRIKRGWTLRDSLENPVKHLSEIEKEEYIDSEGNKFKSKAELANFHNMSIRRYNRLINAGYSLEDDAKHKFCVGNSHVVVDPFGRSHRTLTKMLKFYDIPESSYVGYLITGKTMKDILEDKMNGKLQRFHTSMSPYKVVDHLGVTYNTSADMCRHYNITKTGLAHRLLRGYSLEKALTTPTKPSSIQAKAVKDHLGNNYKSITAMCKHYNITRSAYNNRIKNGWNLEKVLTTPLTFQRKFNRL